MIGLIDHDDLSPSSITALSSACQKRKEMYSELIFKANALLFFGYLSFVFGTRMMALLT